MFTPPACPRRGTAVAVFAALLALGIALPGVAASPFHGARPRTIVLSNPTVFTDDPLVAGVTLIKGEHLTEVRAAVNFYRLAAGLQPIVFTSEFPIQSFDILQLRAALDPARAALNLAPLSYTDPTISEVTLIKAAHLQELREAARVILVVCGITVTLPTVTVSTIGQPFSEVFTQNGAIGNATFTIESGTLPGGLALAPNGLLSGTPTATGSFPITVHVADVNGCSATSATYNLQIVAAPSIASFVAAPATITTGGSSQLTGNFAGGSAVITNNRNASTIAPASGSPAGVTPSLPTTYTLTVTNAAGDSTTATATVTVVPPPTATVLIATPNTITAGTSSQLTATFAGGTGVITFNTGPGSINTANGTPVTVSPLSTTTYTLTVTNAAGTSATLTTTVTVIPPPAISSFTATPDHITVGDSSTLAATFSGTSATIVSTPPGTSTPIASGGTFPVSPVSTTVYTLTVLNALGATVSANVLVTVVPQPVCTSLDVSKTAITNGDFLFVTPVFSNGVATIDYSTDSFITLTSIPGPFTSGFQVFAASLSCPSGCTASFRLTVTNPLATTCQAFSPSVDISPQPVITNFTSTATSVVATTGTFRLTPTFSGGTGTIVPGLGIVSSGVQTALLTIPSSRTFTLTLTNNAGKTVTRTLTVNTTGTLTASAALAAGRFEATATRLPNGKVLIAGGSLTNGGVGLQTGTVFDPATNSYTATGSLTAARANHTATLLPNGKVLLAGGRDGVGTTGNPQATLELYDMVANTFSAVAAPLGAPRTGHTATLLPNGNVLIAGGSGTNSVDLFVSSNATVTTLSAAAGAIAIRQAHTATLLPNGKVWLAGGGTNTTEFFDWTNNTFQAGPGLAFTPSNATATLMSNGLVLIAGGTASRLDVQTFDYTTTTLSVSSLGGGMAVARTKASATPLPDGRVLIEGGEQTAAASASLFDPVNVTFAATPVPSAVHVTAFTALLGNGKVFFGGGASTATQVFDPGLSTPHLVTATGPMESARERHAITLLPNGQALVTGGQLSSGVASIADSFVNTNDAAGNFRAGGFVFSGFMGIPRYVHTATLLPNGKILIVGGFGSTGVVSQAEIWDNGTFTSPAGVLSTRGAHTATVLPNARVLLAGGSPGTGNATTSVDLYDVGTGTVSAAAPMGTARSGHTATLLPNGKVLVTGGLTNAGVSGTAELYDPNTDTWTAGPATPAGFAREFATATLLPNGKVLIVGGSNLALTPATGAFLYDWATNTFATVASPVFERADVSAALLPDGKVLLSAGRGLSGTLDTTEIYDPTTDTWSFGASLAQPVFAHRSILLGNGKVLVTGGETNSAPIAASSVFQ